MSVYMQSCRSVYMICVKYMCKEYNTISKNNNTKVTGVKIGNIDLIVCDRYCFTQKIPFGMWIIKCLFKICLIIYNYILMHIYFYIYHCVIAFIYKAICFLSFGKWLYKLVWTFFWSVCDYCGKSRRSIGAYGDVLFA